MATYERRIPKGPQVGDILLSSGLLAGATRIVTTDPTLKQYGSPHQDIVVTKDEAAAQKQLSQISTSKMNNFSPPSDQRNSFGEDNKLTRGVISHPTSSDFLEEDDIAHEELEPPTRPATYSTRRSTSPDKERFLKPTTASFGKLRTKTKITIPPSELRMRQASEGSLDTITQSTKESKQGSRKYSPMHLSSSVEFSSLSLTNSRENKTLRSVPLLNTKVPRTAPAAFGVATHVALNTNSLPSLSSQSNNFSSVPSLPPTKIPEKYHKVETFPIRPVAFGKDTEGLEYSDNTWKKTWFPSSRPIDRREVQQLSATFEHMMQELEKDQQHNSNNGSSGNNESSSQIEKEQQIYDAVLHELIRQVYVECADRGVLLQKVSDRYRDLFLKVPVLLGQMQDEINNLVDANKSLRMLLEKLMEERDSSDARLEEQTTKLEVLEKEVAELRKSDTEHRAKVKDLTRERDDALTSSMRFEEDLSYQESVAKQLELKDKDAQENIKTLTSQLEEALNKLHESELLLKLAERKRNTTTVKEPE